MQRDGRLPRLHCQDGMVMAVAINVVALLVDAAEITVVSEEEDRPENTSSPERVPAISNDASKHREGSKLISCWGIHSTSKRRSEKTINSGNQARTDNLRLQHISRTSLSFIRRCGEVEQKWRHLLHLRWFEK